MATASGTALCNYFWPSFKPFPLSGERCVTTYDKKANKLSIQNNGIHQRRGRHTCLAPRTMPHCLFIRCQKSLCLLGDSDSNLILFIFFWGGGISSFGERRGRMRGRWRKDGWLGWGGEKSDSHFFFLPSLPSLLHSEFSFFLIAVCQEVRRQITKTVILAGGFH